MKKSILLSVLATVLLFVPATAIAQNLQDFEIESFTADYYLDRDDQGVATFRVKEEIVALFPDQDQNRGILRALPQTYKDHSLDLEIVSVTDGANQERQYSTETSNGNLVLRIGDPNSYAHGEQTYAITYTVRGVATHYDDHDEIYWDVNGTQWQQPFDSITARIHVPTELADTYTNNAACYTGAQGASTSNCRVHADETGDGLQITVATSEPFTAGENLSYVLGFEASTFEPYQRTPGDQALFLAKLIGGWILPPVVALIVAGRLWYMYGRDPKGKGTIIPRYTPPEEITVLGANVLLEEKLEPKGVSAQIIDLAVRGYIKIYEEKEKRFLKDDSTYTLELTQDYSELSAYEREVIKMLFGANAKPTATVKLETLKNTLAQEVRALGRDVSAHLSRAGYFRGAPHTVKVPYLVVGFLLFFLGFFLFPVVGGGIVIAGGIILVVSKFMPARTKAGVELRDHLYGLREYMQLAEADRIKTMQSPSGSLTEKVDTPDKGERVKIYEQLLPYAILFEIEEEWAKQFADMYDQEPDWYHGTSAFHGAAFASSIASFKTASTASFTAPSSSSSSGFGGGGFSGGGGGGGGGGGW